MGAGIRAGRHARSVVRTLAEILDHPHVEQRGTLTAVEVPELGRTVDLVGAGFRFEHGQPAFQEPRPRLGEHTDEVLAELDDGAP